MTNNAHTPQVRTTAQVTAANPQSSVWVSANAGTGKTQVLTDRITRLLLDGVKPERILCLTFTKAAAAEMATRLSDRLGGWAMANDDVLIGEITALLGKAPEKTLLAPARRLFAETLDVPGSGPQRRFCTGSQCLNTDGRTSERRRLRQSDERSFFPARPFTQPVQALRQHRGGY